MLAARWADLHPGEERALRLLHTVAQNASGTSAAHAPEDAGNEGQDPELVTEADVQPAQNDADDPDPCPTCHTTGQVTGDPSPLLKPVDPRRLLPHATLYVHLTDHMRTRTDHGGVARVEGIGPATRQQVIELLGHTHVRVVPVLADQHPVDAYEVPTTLTEALHLLPPPAPPPGRPT